MADAVGTHGAEFAHPRERGAAFELGGLVTEASGGAAVVVLAILGLLHVAPDMLASIATIVLGASFLLLGGMMAAWFMRVMRSISSPMMREAISEGVTLESLCGAAGVVLGILAFVTGAATTLVPIAAIVFGGALLVARGATSRLSLGRSDSQEPASQSVMPASDAFYVSSAPGVLIAIAGVVLGIIALAGHASTELSLVALLDFGVGILLSGSSFASAVMSAPSA